MHIKRHMMCGFVKVVRHSHSAVINIFVTANSLLHLECWGMKKSYECEVRSLLQLFFPLFLSLFSSPFLPCALISLLFSLLSLFIRIFWQVFCSKPFSNVESTIRAKINANNFIIRGMPNTLKQHVKNIITV